MCGNWVSPLFDQWSTRRLQGDCINTRNTFVMFYKYYFHAFSTITFYSPHPIHTTDWQTPSMCALNSSLPLLWQVLNTGLTFRSIFLPRYTEERVKNKVDVWNWQHFASSSSVHHMVTLWKVDHVLETKLWGINGGDKLSGLCHFIYPDDEN